MDNEKAIEILNSLIEINNDRIEGYETASEETNENDLKVLFASFIGTSQKCKDELVKEVVSLGGEPEDGTRVSGKFFRTWMDVKAALTLKDRKAIMSSCEFGEDFAVDTYKKALEKSEHLSPEQYSMIDVQCNQIKFDHDRVKSLRNKL